MRKIFEVFDMSKKEEVKNTKMIICINSPLVKVSKLICYFIEFVFMYIGFSYIGEVLNLTRILNFNQEAIQVGFLSFTYFNTIIGFLGMFMYVYGRYHLTAISKANKGVYGKDLLTDGYYEHIRHPLYGKLLIMQIGIISALCLWCTAVLSFLWTGVMVLNVLIEEKGLLIIYAENYRTYMYRTRHRLFNSWQFIMMTIILIVNLHGILKA